MTPVFFDHASTTRCCEEAADRLRHFTVESYGNPSSAHAYGQEAARAIREARLFLAETFRIGPGQVIFTGSGTEADNLALYGIALALRNPARILISATEHPAVRETALSLEALGFDVKLIPVTRDGQIDEPAFENLLTPETRLVSIQQVNNITGARLPVEALARKAKDRVSGVLFHTDAVQALGKVPVPGGLSSIDLVSISAHKVEGPKGVGALMILNPGILPAHALRPLLWGGGQEDGLRSGTQNAGLIAGFHFAAARALRLQPERFEQATLLRDRLRDALCTRALLAPDSPQGVIRWNSPDSAVPQIVNLSAPGFSSGPITRLLEERGFLVSPGSACSSQKPEPDPVLAAMGLPLEEQTSALRISFGPGNTPEQVDSLVEALTESLELMMRLSGVRPRKPRPQRGPVS